MKTIVVANQKGGCGKTSVVRNLGVAASAAGKSVILLDLDPQRSLTSWWNEREADEPTMPDQALEAGDVSSALRAASRQGFDLALIDTPPSVHPEMANVFKRADLVIVPVRPSPDDLRAVGDSLTLIERAKADFIFVLSQAKSRTRLATEAVAVLAQHGKVSPAVLHDRVQYAQSAITGKGVTETGDRNAAKEVSDLLKYVNTQLRRNA